MTVLVAEGLESRLTRQEFVEETQAMVFARAEMKQNFSFIIVPTVTDAAIVVQINDFSDADLIKNK